MPSTSRKQHTLMCIALGMKKGSTPKTYSKEAARMCDSMTVTQLEDYCKNPVKK